MTLEGVLFGLICLLTILLWSVSGLLINGAFRRPRIVALSAMAVFIPLIALLFTDFVASVINRTFGYPIPRDVATVVFEGVLIGIGIWALWFVWLFVTGRFHDPDNGL